MRNHFSDAESPAPSQRGSSESDLLGGSVTSGNIADSTQAQAAQNGVLVEVRTATQRALKSMCDGYGTYVVL